MKRSILSFIYDQWSTVPPVETTDLSGKTVAVVGANTGLGFEAAKHFARMSPGKLIIACRNENKGKTAISGTFWSLGHTLDADTHDIKTSNWLPVARRASFGKSTLLTLLP